MTGKYPFALSLSKGSRQAKLGANGVLNIENLNRGSQPVKSPTSAKPFDYRNQPCQHT